jgi:hypothetical protein
MPGSPFSHSCRSAWTLSLSGICLNTHACFGNWGLPVQCMPQIVLRTLTRQNLTGTMHYAHAQCAHACSAVCNSPGHNTTQKGHFVLLVLHALQHAGAVQLSCGTMTGLYSSWLSQSLGHRSPAGGCSHQEFKGFCCWCPNGERFRAHSQVTALSHTTMGNRGCSRGEIFLQDA